MGNIEASDPKHIEIQGYRDGKARCKCGWQSAFGGKYREHQDGLGDGEARIKELAMLRKGISWFGAQGNLVPGDRPWDGVVAVMHVIDDRIKEIKAGMEPETVTVSAIVNTDENDVTTYTVLPTGCPSSINIQGEHFGCILEQKHEGLAHRNPQGQALWY